MGSIRRHKHAMSALLAEYTDKEDMEKQLYLQEITNNKRFFILHNFHIKNSNFFRSIKDVKTKRLHQVVCVQVSYAMHDRRKHVPLLVSGNIL